MKLDGTTLALVVGAVATPTVLRYVHPPGYVTAGQKAALAVFHASGPTISPTVRAALAHAVDLTGAQVVADLVLAAAHAGAFVVVPNGQGGEAYNPLDSVEWFLGTNIDAGGFFPDIREAQWVSLDGGDHVSTFGAAVGRVMHARKGGDAGELADACRALASAMDDLGVRDHAPVDLTPVSWATDKLRALLPSTSTMILVGAAALGALVVAHKVGAL